MYNNHELKVKRLSELATMPTRSYDDDVGLDLYLATNASVSVRGHELIILEFDISVELPQGTWGMLMGRSSTGSERRLLVLPGMLDPGYRGKLSAVIFNLSPQTQTIEPQARVAQLIISIHPGKLNVVEVEELNPSARGEAGFGSTGR